MPLQSRFCYGLLAVALTVPAFAAEPLNTLTAQEQKEGYRLLFDGKTIDGWDGAPGLWSVRDGILVGSSHNRTMTGNSFLISNEAFSDFILRLDMKVVNENSGVQFRSEALPNWVVRGYQADAAFGKWWGSLYGEKTGRGVIVDGYRNKGEKVVREGDWNTYEIICHGKKITLILNGLVTADTEDEMSSEGIIALQLHRGPPMEVQFRNVRIRTLN